MEIIEQPFLCRVGLELDALSSLVSDPVEVVEAPAPIRDVVLLAIKRFQPALRERDRYLPQFLGRQLLQR